MRLGCGLRIVRRCSTSAASDPERAMHLVEGVPVTTQDLVGGGNISKFIGQLQQRRLRFILCYRVVKVFSCRQIEVGKIQSTQKAIGR